ncbi:MAG TPA: hypothetical protein VKC99_06840 [Methyloceanibacter sp.]|nr:hypothetical protein [Methyloceanibacter sp.]
MNFVDYRNQLLQRREGEIAQWQLVRNFSQWFFDLLRNFVLVGGLKYFYEKSGSEVLFYLHQFALGVIFLFPFLRRPVVRQPVRLPRQPARCALAQSHRQHHHCCHAVPGDQVGGFPDRNRDLACAALTTSAWRVGLHRSLCANL